MSGVRNLMVPMGKAQNSLPPRPTLKRLARCTAAADAFELAINAAYINSL